MKKRTWINGCFVLFCLFALLWGCGQEETKKKDTDAKEIKIPMILTVDPSTGKKNEEKVIEEFNRKYKGKYEVQVEWIVETEDEYRQNLKRLNVTDELPAVITDLRMLPSFYQKMIKDERIIDLTSYIQKDQEWCELIEPVVLEGCRAEDGNIYLAPLSTAAFSCSGVFWNQQLFDRAGIHEFPETWDEFWVCCDKLEAAGITPLALHTDGTAWASMLFATAKVGGSSTEGAAFMEQIYPKSYDNKSGMELADTLKKLFTYTTEDALYADFDVAYNNFFSGKAAMIPNGYWMIDQIPDEWQERTRFSAFPENTLISSPETFGWAVTSSYKKEIQTGALEFLKFRTALNKKEKETFFARDKEKISPVERDYMETYENNPQLVPNYQVKWNTIFQEETLSEYLPELIGGQMDSAQFIQMADESIRRFETEK